MKGTIHRCLSEVVIKHFGEDTWRNILHKTGFEADRNFALSDDVEEELSLKLIQETVSTVGVEAEAVFDLFGEHWVCEYAPKHYAFWYIGAKNAKEFMLKLDNIHSIVGRHFNNAKPPRFLYEEKSPNILEIEYKSNRSFLPLFISLVKGVGVYFKEAIDIIHLSDNKIQLHFGANREEGA